MIKIISAETLNLNAKAAYGTHTTPVGTLFLAIIGDVLVRSAIVADKEESCLEDLKRVWPAYTFKKNSAATAPYARQVMEALRSSPNFKIAFIGTDFQKQVWRALLGIPSGHLASYQDIARAIGNPKSVRAVGQAVGANPIGLAIPCHRVIRSDGSLGGFAWGTATKQAILDYERSLALAE